MNISLTFYKEWRKMQKNSPKLVSNRASDDSHVSQLIEDEIKRVEQILARLESKSTQLSNEDQIAYRRMRSSLRKYLNVLYQARRFLTRHVPLVAIEQYLTRLISLQAVFEKYAAVFRNTPLAVKLFTEGANVLVFLVACVSSALMAESKKRDGESIDIFDFGCFLKDKAKILYSSSDFITPPPSILTTYPVFLPPKKDPSKGDGDQDKDMKSTDDDTNNEAKLLPCDDASGNMTSHSKSIISSGNKERNSDEAASTSSASTPAENLQHNQNGGEVVDEVPPTTPVQDTSSHTSVDDLHFSSGHTSPSTPLNVLEIETKRTIASFNDTGGLPDTAQQLNSQQENVPPSGSVVTAVQESNGQNDTNKMVNAYQPTNVPDNEEQFMLSPGSRQ